MPEPPAWVQEAQARLLSAEPLILAPPALDAVPAELAAPPALDPYYEQLATAYEDLDGYPDWDGPPAAPAAQRAAPAPAVATEPPGWVSYGQAGLNLAAALQRHAWDGWDQALGIYRDALGAIAAAVQARGDPGLRTDPTWSALLAQADAAYAARDVDGVATHLEGLLDRTAHLFTQAAP